MEDLARRLRTALMQIGDDAKVPSMRAYMKSAMPFIGVSSVPLAEVCRELFRPLDYSSSLAWQHDVRSLWRGAQFREERYAAILLSGIRAARPFQRFDAIGMYEEMIVSGGWWDYVDPIATQRLWDIYRSDQPRTGALMRHWSTGHDIWKRRCAILCQNRAKQATDTALLYDCIEPSMDSKEFFLRKAIGWALREYAKTSPDEVLRYVSTHEARLSGLSRREALKNIVPENQ